MRLPDFANAYPHAFRLLWPQCSTRLSTCGRKHRAGICLRFGSGSRRDACRVRLVWLDSFLHCDAARRLENCLRPVRKGHRMRLHRRCSVAPKHPWYPTCACATWLDGPAQCVDAASPNTGECRAPEPRAVLGAGRQSVADNTNTERRVGFGYIHPRGHADHRLPGDHKAAREPPACYSNVLPG